jgi:hypothetical protein
MPTPETDEAGPQDVFTGPMAAVITRRVKRMFILSNATFTSMAYMFPSGEALAVPTTTPTYPALTELRNIKSFRLLTGSALVVFYASV